MSFLGNFKRSEEVINTSDQLRDLATGFIRRREHEVDQLKMFCIRHNYDAIRVVAHKLTGSGASFGFPAFSELGTRLGEAAATKDDEKIYAVIQNIVTTIEEVKAEFLAK